MTYSTITLDYAAPFATVTLNRPKQRNAMSFQMVDELLAAFTELRDRTDIRAVVITGAGGNFCSGGDIGDLQAAADMTADEQDARAARLDTLLRAVNEAPQIVIAKIDGAALGGGFGLACVADIGIASTTATFGMPEVRLGLAPAVIAPFVLQRIGLTRARILMLTGSRFDGVTAHEYGIIHEVCPAEILDECVNATLEEIRQASPASIRAIKALMHESHSKGLDDTLAYRARLLNSMRQSEEGQEGMLAFMMKRPPAWAKTED